MRVSTMLSVAALLVGLSVVSSCNDTKDDAKKEEVKELPNCFSVADTTINLVSGTQWFYGAEGGKFGDNNDIYIVLEGEKDNAGDPTQERTVIALEFCIDKADTALVAGTYPFSGTESYPVGTFVPYDSHYSIDVEDWGYADIESGEAVVKLSGEIYEITFVGKDKFGKDVKAHYKGKLKWIDERKEEVKTNCFSVADTTINLVSCQWFYIAGDESYGGNNDINIVLYGEDASGLTESSEIGLDFCVDKAHTALVAGTYKYSAEEPYVVGTLTPNGSYYSVDGGNWKDIVSGEAVVKLSEGNCEITFVGKDKFGKEVKAYYKGKL